MADEESTSKDEIEQLLNEARSAEPPAEPTQPADPEALGKDEIDSLLKSEEGTSGSENASTQSQPEPDTAATAAGTKDASATLAQDDVESLLGAGTEQGASAKRQPSAADLGLGGADGIAEADVEYLLNQAQGALASIDEAGDQPDSFGISPYRFADFTGAPPNSDAATLDLIRDVEMEVKIELGRTNMYLEEVLRLRKGSVVPLDKLAGDPVDIYVNGRLIARGEVLVLNDNFCVRVGELISGEAAMAS